jgi:uncharacterized protein (DUF302 family)
MFSLHLFGAPSGAPPFLWRLCLLAGLLAGPAAAADDVVLRAVAGSDYRAAREALIESIESEGLVVGTPLPFGEMLVRTAPDGAGSPFVAAEIVQFCSSGLAREMVGEAPEQLALCPLSVALYVLPGEAGKVFLAYRSPGAATPARVRAAELLQRVVDRAAGLAPLR